jgi:hypothetical protein
MPRSVFSNPIESGLRAAREMVGIMRDVDEAPLRRELLAQEVADKRLSSERTKKTMEYEDKVRAQWEKAIGRENATKDRIEALSLFAGAHSELEAAAKEGRKANLTPAHKKAVFDLLQNSELFDPDRIDEQLTGIRTVRGFMAQNAEALQQGGKVDLEKYPEVQNALNAVFGKQLNRGTDRNGLSEGVEKRIRSVIIDPTDQTLVFGLDVRTPVKEGQVFRPDGSGSPTYTVNPKAKGLVERGNIDIANRPAVRNADGSVSTVRSISIEEEGKEILIPTISMDGRFLTNDQAIAEYHKTGKHLGKFDSPEDASAYAEQLHADQQNRYGKFSAVGQESTSYSAPITASRGGTDPNDMVLKIPAQMLDSYLNAHEVLGSTIDRLKAESKPEEYAANLEKVKKARTSAGARGIALSRVDTTKTPEEQRRQFVIEYSRLDPDTDGKTVADLAKTLIPEKSVAMASEAGKQVSDRARLVAAHGESSPQVQEFDRSVDAKRQGQQRGESKTIYGPNGQTKEVFIERGKDYTPPAGWSLKAPKDDADGSGKREKRIDTELDKVEPLFVKEYRQGDKLIESIEDLDLEDSEKEKIHKQVDRALELVRKGKSAVEAKRQAQKEIGAANRLKPITADVVKQIRSKAKTRQEAERMAKEMGYDPNTPAKEM